MVAVLTVKRGDTWRFECVRTDEDGAPAPLTGVDIASEITLGRTRKALSVEVTDAAAGKFSLSLSAFETAQLAARSYRADVEFTENGVVESTDTFLISVIEDITNAG